MMYVSKATVQAAKTKYVCEVRAAALSRTHSKGKQSIADGATAHFGSLLRWMDGVERSSEYSGKFPVPGHYRGTTFQHGWLGAALQPAVL